MKKKEKFPPLTISRPIKSFSTFDLANLRYLAACQDSRAIVSPPLFYIFENSYILANDLGKRPLTTINFRTFLPEFKFGIHAVACKLIHPRTPNFLLTSTYSLPLWQFFSYADQHSLKLFSSRRRNRRKGLRRFKAHAEGFLELSCRRDSLFPATFKVNFFEVDGWNYASSYIRAWATIINSNFVLYPYWSPYPFVQLSGILTTLFWRRFSRFVKDDLVSPSIPIYDFDVVYDWERGTVSRLPEISRTGLFATLTMLIDNAIDPRYIYDLNGDIALNAVFRKQNTAKETRTTLKPWEVFPRSPIPITSENSFTIGGWVVRDFFRKWLNIFTGRVLWDPYKQIEHSLEFEKRFQLSVGKEFLANIVNKRKTYVDFNNLKKLLKFYLYNNRRRPLLLSFLIFYEFLRGGWKTIILNFYLFFFLKFWYVFFSIKRYLDVLFVPRIKKYVLIWPFNLNKLKYTKLYLLIYSIRLFLQSINFPTFIRNKLVWSCIPLLLKYALFAGMVGCVVYLVAHFFIFFLKIVILLFLLFFFIAIPVPVITSKQSLFSLLRAPSGWVFEMQRVAELANKRLWLSRLSLILTRIFSLLIVELFLSFAKTVVDLAILLYTSLISKSFPLYWVYRPSINVSTLVLLKCAKIRIALNNLVSCFNLRDLYWVFTWSVHIAVADISWWISAKNTDSVLWRKAADINAFLHISGVICKSYILAPLTSIFFFNFFFLLELLVQRLNFKISELNSLFLLFFGSFPDPFFLKIQSDFFINTLSFNYFNLLSRELNPLPWLRIRSYTFNWYFIVTKLYKSMKDTYNFLYYTARFLLFIFFIAYIVAWVIKFIVFLLSIDAIMLQKFAFVLYIMACLIDSSDITLISVLSTIFPYITYSYTLCISILVYFTFKILFIVYILARK